VAPFARFGGPPVTNIRNISPPHWRGWLKSENRCLVPANSFSEYAPEPNPATGKKDVVWFALNEIGPSSLSPESRPSFEAIGVPSRSRSPAPAYNLRLPGDGADAIVEPITQRPCRLS
jgi:hypothetical protein